MVAAARRDGTAGEAAFSEVQALTQAASELVASGFAEGDSMDTGLAQPAYELAVGLTDGSEERVLIGNQDPSGQYYASRDGSDVIFLTSDWTLKQFRRRARGLLKQD